MSLDMAMHESARGNRIADQAIREVLSRMLESPIFAQSDRLGRFLRFTVEATLAGKGETLKEYLIGTEVYDRKPPYHPSADSIVRSEARRLRNKLQQYYESVGKDDPVFIYYRPGSYIPAFRARRSQVSDPKATERVLADLLSEGLVAHALDFPFATGKLEVQIVFEGTVRILPSAAASSTRANLRSGQALCNGNQIRKVVSMSLKKSAGA